MMELKVFIKFACFVQKDFANLCQNSFHNLYICANYVNI